VAFAFGYSLFHHVMNERRPMLIPPRLTMFGMIPTFANSFVDLIKRTLLDASRGIASSHHVHNVGAGIANILCLIEHDDSIGAASDRLTQSAANYLNRHIRNCPS
jgi:hypothetical protein